LERNFVGETQQKLLSSILPRPKFSGNPFDWVDFAREFQFYWKFNNFGPEIYSVILLSCLPADDQVLYRGHLAKGMSKDVFVRQLNDRFAIREKYTTRERWYGMKLAVSKSVLGFEKFVLLWETLRDELPGVSEDESKQAFLTALPTPLRSLTLKREAKAEKLFSTSECVQFLRKHLSAESRASDLEAELNSSANISVQAVQAKRGGRAKGTKSDQEAAPRGRPSKQDDDVQWIASGSGNGSGPTRGRSENRPNDTKRDSTSNSRGPGNRSTSFSGNRSTSFSGNRGANSGGGGRRESSRDNSQKIVCILCKQTGHRWTDCSRNCCTG
jgi:uncharacterized membrane protein YgcG